MLAHSLTIVIALKHLLLRPFDVLDAIRVMKGNAFQLPVMWIVVEGQETVQNMCGGLSELLVQMFTVLTVITMVGDVSSKLCFWFPKTLDARRMKVH